MPIAEDDGAKGAVADLLDRREGASGGLGGMSKCRQNKRRGTDWSGHLRSGHRRG